MNIRRRSLTDSLQLLVDTICNLFGSIVIISLLMALLSKDTSTDATVAQHTASLQSQLKQTQTDLEEAQHLHTTITPSVEDTQRLAFAAEIAELKTIVSSNLAIIQSNSTRIATADTSDATETLQHQKITLTTDLTALTNQLTRLKQATARQLRLPRERATGKKTFYFVIRYSKIYPIHIMTSGGRRTLNTESLTWRETTGGQTATPNRDGGLDMTNLPTFARLFNDIPATTYSIHFLVYNDSFPAFLAARQIPLGRGYDVGWEFFPEDRPILFSAQGEAPPAL